MVTNNNSRNLTPTTDRQGVSNRDIVGITAPQQNLLQHGFESRKTSSVKIKKG